MNKKLSVYSGGFDVLGEERTTLDPVDYQGLEVEPTEELPPWFNASLARLA